MNLQSKDGIHSLINKQLHEEMIEGRTAPSMTGHVTKKRMNRNKKLH